MLTNYHVIRGASGAQVATTATGDTTEVESVVAFNVERDIAALRIPPLNIPPLSIGNSDAVKIGDHVTAIGAPMGLENTLSDGIVSAVREMANERVIQMSAPISPGSSGGPVFDDHGKVIGLTVASMLGGQSLNFAVPVNAVQHIMQSSSPMSFREMLERTRVQRAVFATISVPPRQLVPVPFVVESQEGALLSGDYSVSGGFGNDIGVAVISAQKQVMLRPGVVKAA